MKHIELGATDLTLEHIRACLVGPVEARLAGAARARVAAGAALVAQMAAGEAAVYGVNTGFGKLATTRIPGDKLAELQRNLVTSHAAGVGPMIATEETRAIILLKAQSLAQGASGVRPEIVDLLAAMLAKGVAPEIPARGSVGASGDLAPLAHLTLVAIGLGHARLDGGARRGGAQALDEAGLAPATLGPKEGLALLNGTQVSTGLALSGLIRAERLARAALIVGALSVDAAAGADTPFDARIHELRRQAGQIAVAARLRDLLAGSEIRSSHADCPRVQDPYSLRCQPQVMGACLDQLAHAASVLMTEANAVSDNPLVFTADGEVLSGGNFHAEPIAFAADGIALALAETAAMSERRTALLTDPNMTGLPAFLTPDPGLNSGYMLAHVTAAALASELKALAAPRVVDSLPTSANQEDHVSMATAGALRLGEMADHVATILGVEFLAAVEAIEFRRPLRSSAPLETAIASLRERVAPRPVDREMAPDIAAAARLVETESFAALAGPPLIA